MSNAFSAPTHHAIIAAISLARPGIASVIAGATRPEQIEQNVNAAGWKPSEADLAELDRITLPPS